MTMQARAHNNIVNRDLHFTLTFCGCGVRRGHKDVSSGYLFHSSLSHYALFGSRHYGRSLCAQRDNNDRQTAISVSIHGPQRSRA